MPIKYINRNTWTNFHENINVPVMKIGIASNSTGSKWEKYNATSLEIVDLITEAIDTGTSFKANGSKWSMSHIAMNKNIMIDTSNMGIQIELESTDMNANYVGQKNDVLFTQCGAIIKLISKTLKAKGKSLKAVGASNGQTIGGAISTGVHGSAIDFGSVQDAVVGLNIIVNSGKNVYLEKASYPVVSDDFVAKMNATIIRDDDMFNAALVSMGCFGFIHGVLIENENIFGLQTYVEKIKYSDAQFLMDTLDFNASNYKITGKENVRPWHFKLYINPYKINDAIYAETMFKVPLPSNYSSPHANTSTSTYNKDLLNNIALFAEKFNGNDAAIIEAMEKFKFLKEEHGENIYSLADTFYDTTTAGDTFACGIGISINHASKTLEILKQLITELGGIPSIFALRFVKKSNALMAFTAFEQTCIFEIDGLRTSKNATFVQRIPDKLKASGIPFTFHWGKDNPMNAAMVSSMYGTKLDKFIHQRSMLLTPIESKIFRGYYTDGLGLNIHDDTASPIIV